MKTGIQLIMDERREQVEKGYGIKHDVEHGQLLQKAYRYLFSNSKYTIEQIQDLTRAGALIAAEIDRLIYIEENKKP